MNGIPPDLNKRLRDLLLETDIIHNSRQLLGLFSDERLRPWRNGLPQSDNAQARVDLLIDYLHNKTHKSFQENALILFIKVLSQRIDPGDNLHANLEHLIGDLIVAREYRSYLPFQSKYGRELVSIAGLMRDSINLSELKSICFELVVDYDELPGGILSEKTHELVLFLNRQERIPELLALMQKLRPKIDWSTVYEEPPR